MTAPAKAITIAAAKPLTALERARRGLPLVERGTATDEQTVDLQALARQLVAVALRVEGVEPLNPVPTEAP